MSEWIMLNICQLGVIQLNNTEVNSVTDIALSSKYPNSFSQFLNIFSCHETTNLGNNKDNEGVLKNV